MWDTIIIQPMTNLLLWIYDLLGHGPHMFGLAIILFTILIKVITWPLNASQVKGAQAMQELQNDKEWQEIQKKYAKDKEKIAQEQMRIYKERGINPFASCLPTLDSIPHHHWFVSKHHARAFCHTIGHAQTCPHFISLPECGRHHSAQQHIFVDGSWPPRSQFHIPFGIVAFLPYGIPLLAIIVALTTYIQSKLTMPTSTNPNDQSAQMTKMMSIYMPLMLGWFALNFASGIAVYFITSNLLGIVQYAATGRANWSNLLPGGNKNKQISKKK